MSNKIRFHEIHSPDNNFSADVISGLEKRPARIPPKYFYDAKGSGLFDQITELAEYYPTRTEIDILKKNADEIADLVGTGSLLVEPGGGSLAKVHILLQGLRPCAYVPMDISRDHLKFAAEELATAFPWLEIHAACVDFTQAMQLPPTTPAGTRVAFFPGSSIGNFHPQAAVDFMQSVADMVGPGGYLLIGVDLKKDTETLESAYDDAAGVTAAFNLNLLTRINRELDANFDLSNWQHRAIYNEQRGRIEMYLVSACEQSVSVGDQHFKFTSGETIHTENSYKYSSDEFIRLAAEAGYLSSSLWIDEAELFSVHLFQVDPEVNKKKS